jgi:hypothetical protein
VTAQRHKVRLHFLIALTLAVMALGVSRFLRTYRRQQAREQYVRTEQELRRYTTELLEKEHAELTDLALAERGLVGRDAAALLMQVRQLVAEQGRRGRSPGQQPAARAIGEIRANFNRIRLGKPAVFPKGKPLLRGYYSPIDGSFQPYGIALPKGYDGDRPYPLILTLHCDGTGESFECLDAPSYEGAISVRPGGRGTVDFMLFGEEDVLAILAEVKALYNVEEGRVYLAGRSKGALGCWNLAVHYPHLFGGIAVVDGPSGWCAARSAPWATGAKGRPTHEELRGFLRASVSPRSYAENLEHCSIVAVDTARAAEGPAGGARAMIERLRSLGYRFEYLEFPVAAPGGLAQWPRDYALARALGSSVAGTPAHFSFKTGQVRHGRAWWLRLSQLADPVQFATVRASLVDGRAEISTQNVQAVTVLLKEAPEPIRVVSIDGVEFEAARNRRAEEFAVHRLRGKWQTLRGRYSWKHKGQSGPFSDVLREPFLVVYGTRADTGLHNEMSYREAMRFASHWERVHGRPPRLKADSEVAASEMRGLNLLLFGGPVVNDVTRQMMVRTPVQVQEGGVAVGDDFYAGQDVGMMVCYPSPFGGGRLFAVVAGTSPQALYQAYDRTGLWYDSPSYHKYKWFDYAVFDGRTVGPASFKTVGFFNNAWQLDQSGRKPFGGGASWRADPRAVAELVPQGFPVLRTAADSPDKDVFLSDVRPDSIEQIAGAVAFDRTFAGKPIQIGEQTFQRGLGVKAPSYISFTLGMTFWTFRSTVGLTPGFENGSARTGPKGGGLVFEVWGDGQLVEASEPLSWKERGRDRARIEADIRGVRILTLVVRSADGRPSSLCGAWAGTAVSR